MVRIRLRRTGKTKQPSYRVVVADSRSPRDGKFVEIIGHYSPVRNPKVLHIKQDRARYWMGVGAQPSDTVVYLFKKVNILDENGQVIPESVFTQSGDKTDVLEPIATDALEPIATESDEETVEETAFVKE